MRSVVNRNVVMRRMTVLETRGHALINVTFRWECVCRNAHAFHADEIRCRFRDMLGAKLQRLVTSNDAGDIRRCPDCQQTVDNLRTTLRFVEVLRE